MAIHRHHESGCIVVADSRLQCRDDLVRTLGLPQGFATHPDAELIALAWLQKGESCVDLLDGDYAIALLDPRTRTLFCARDRMGVRPLYVHFTTGRLFAFASRPLALLQLPDIPDDVDEGRIADALTAHLEAIDKTSTFYAAIKRLPPAQWLRLRGGHCHQHTYWTPGIEAPTPIPRDEHEWIERFSITLERAVARQLERGDAIGCMLSGGLDSSSLAVIARDQNHAAGRGALATFSSIDDAPGCPETRSIRAVLEQPGFNATCIGPGELEPLRAELIAASDDADEPFDGGAYILSLQYLMASRNGLTALMDGIDADLLLSHRGTIARQVRTLQWGRAWRNARGLERNYPGLRARDTLRAAVRTAWAPGWLRNSVRPHRNQRELDALLKHTLIRRDFAQRIALGDRLRTHAAWSTASPHVGNPSEVAQRYLLHPNTTVGFERYHRLGARFGVEPRHPFDDREVVELSLHLPPDLLLRNGWPKFILRRAMQGRLPDAVCWRAGKEHLGGSLIQRLLLADAAAVRARTEECRPLLVPYVDVGQLDAALARFDAPSAVDAKIQVIQAHNLGQWLENRQAYATATRASCGR